MRTFLRAAPGPTHSRPSPLAIVGRPPMSGESHYPHAPDEFPCDLARSDVELTHDRNADSLVDSGVFDPRAGARPTRDGLRGSARRDRDCAIPGAWATYPCFRQACLDTGRLGSGAAPGPVPGSSAAAGHCLPVRDRRPERGIEDPGPRGSDVRRPHRRGGRDQSDSSSAPASRFTGSVGSGSDAGPARANGVARGPAGTDGQFRGPGARLRVSRPSRVWDRLVPARDSVMPARRGRSPDRLSPKGRNRLGGNSGAWQGCVPRAGSKTK